MNTAERHTGNTRKGFTLIEMVAALFLVSMLAVMLAARDPRSGTNLQVQRDTLEKHLRAAQMHSMQSGGIQPFQGGAAGQVYGLRCDGADYWMFSGINPDAPGAVVPLLDDEAVTLAGGKLSLASKKVAMGAFTIYFTGWGIPCSAYTDETTNTPLAAAQTMTLSADGKNRTVVVNQYTGHIR